MMDKKRQKDFFPITYKEESFLSSYVSPNEEKIFAEKDAGLHHELSEKIYDYIETNKSKYYLRFLKY